MPHIALPEGLPGITSGFAFRPETAKPLRELAEVLLRGPSSLPSAEREMIATFVSTRNDCYFCQTSHRAAAAHHAGGNYELVDAVRFDYPNAPVSAKIEGASGDCRQSPAGWEECHPGRYPAGARGRRHRP
jgi:AhpD family alkylhydroperoxidase